MRIKHKTFDFTLAALLVGTTATCAFAQTEDETRGQYYNQIYCAAVIGKIAAAFETINEATTAKAFEDRAVKHVEDAIALGAKLNMTRDTVIAEFDQQAKKEAENGVFSEQIIVTTTTTCAPELSPMLE
jgi:hypothetical protein